MLVACVSLMFAGCSATTQLSTVYLDGSRSYYYQIQVDEEVCNTYGVDAGEVISLIDSMALSLQAQIQERINGIEKLNEHVTFDVGVADNNPYLYEISWNFDSQQAYYDYYGITQEDLENQEVEVREGAFVSQVVVLDSKLENQQDLLQQLGLSVDLAQIVQTFANQFFDGDVTRCEELFSQIDFNIIRCFPSKLGLKSNADATTSTILSESVNGGDNALYTAFLWQCTLADPTPEIYIYYNALTAANQRAWYFLAIGVAVAFGVILFLIFYFNNKKNQKIIKSLNPNSNSPIIVDTTATPAPDIEKDDFLGKETENKNQDTQANDSNLAKNDTTKENIASNTDLEKLDSTKTNIIDSKDLKKENTEKIKNATESASSLKTQSANSPKTEISTPTTIIAATSKDNLEQINELDTKNNSK